MTNGNQTVSDYGFPNPLGPFDGLNSTYETDWRGPWYGFELSGETDVLHGFVRMEFHQADLYAEADWNLRTDFQHPKSFEQRAEGEGTVLSAGGGIKLSENWMVTMTFDKQDWATDPGYIQFFLANGASGKQKLNEVNWESYALMLGASCEF